MKILNDIQTKKLTSGSVIIKITFIVLLLHTSLVFATEDLRESKVVAEVNGVAITQRELDIGTNRLIPRTYYHRSVSPEKYREIEKKALEELINKELFFQEAKRLGLKAQKSEVKAQLENVKKRYPSKKAFKEALKRNSITIDDLKERIKRDILIKKLQEKEVKVTLTDKELEEYYNKNIQKFKKPESVRLKYIQIKFRPREPDFREKAKAKANEALSKLKAGKDFAEIAWSYSDDMSKIKGGDLGVIHKGRLVPEIEKVAFSLEKGQMSGLIEDNYGFHIVLVEDKKPSTQLSFSEVKEKLRQELTDSYQTKNKEKLIKRLREKAIIKYY